MNKFKFCLYLVFGLILTHSLFAQFDDAPKIREIREKGFLVVGMTAKDQYPFYYKNSKGDFVGLDVDIARTVANAIDVELKINRDAQSFNNLIPLVINGTIDMASSKLSRTLTRAKKVRYTQPYIVFRQALLLNRLELARANIDEKKIKAFLKQFNASIGVIKNSSYERYAAMNFPNAAIVPMNTWDEVVQLGIDGQVFAIYRDELEIHKVMKKNPSNNLILKPVVLTDQTDPIAIAVHSEEPHFVFFLNMILENMNIEKDARKLLSLYEN